MDIHLIILSRALQAYVVTGSHFDYYSSLSITRAPSVSLLD